MSSYFRFHITSHHFPQICTCQAITFPPSCNQIRIWALIGTCATMPMFLPLLSPAPRFRCHSPIWNKNMSKKSISYMAFGSWYEKSKTFSSKHNHLKLARLCSTELGCWWRGNWSHGAALGWERTMVGSRSTTKSPRTKIAIRCVFCIQSLQMLATSTGLCKMFAVQQVWMGLVTLSTSNVGQI